MEGAIPVFTYCFNAASYKKNCEDCVKTVQNFIETHIDFLAESVGKTPKIKITVSVVESE